MMPSDAYDQRVAQYHDAASQAEQFLATQSESRHTPKTGQSRRHRLSRFRYHLSPIARANLRFVVVFLGFAAVVLFAYA